MTVRTNSSMVSVSAIPSAYPSRNSWAEFDVPDRMSFALCHAPLWAALWAAPATALPSTTPAMRLTTHPFMVSLPPFRLGMNGLNPRSKLALYCARLSRTYQKGTTYKSSAPLPYWDHSYHNKTLSLDK